MNKTEKAEMVEALSGDLAKSSNAILFAFAGLKVPEVTELRRQVRGTQSKYLVVKNTLALRATKGTALTTFAKANPNLVFKAAVIEGKAVAASEIKAIAELPSREELVARLLFLMQSPLRRLATVLNGPVRNLAGVMGQIADQKSKSGPAEAAPAS
jgi:large subunit ribosomal protein L10